MDQVIESYSSFTSDFLPRTYQTLDSNLVASPFNILYAFLLLYTGTGDQTRREYQSTFHLPASEEPRQLTSLANSVGDEYLNSFKSASALYVKEGLTPKLDVFFVTTDFTKTDETKQKINSYFSEATNGKIKEAVDNVDPETVMILVSSIYFKGLWESPFVRERTKDEPFWTDSIRSEPVKMMNQYDFYGKYAHLHDLGVKLLEMPYKDSNISMLFVLPDEKDGLNDLIGHYPSAQSKILKADMQYSKVDVKIPKFRIENNIKLKPILKKMGLNSAFEDPHAFEIVKENVPTVISDARHKTFIEVTEEGTEAAAVTILHMVALSSFSNAPIIAPPTFYADHPFIFYILDRNVRLPIFIGVLKEI